MTIENGNFLSEICGKAARKTGETHILISNRKGDTTLSNKHFTKIPGERRDNIVKVRFTDDELECVKSTAELLHLSTAEYIRQMVFTGRIETNVNLSCTNEQMSQYSYELNRIGNNLNQITRQINSGEPLNNEAMDCIKDIHQMIWSQSQQIRDMSGGNG